MASRFAFVIHPIDPKRDVQRRFPLLGKVLPASLIHFFSRFFPPVYISHVTGARSEATGEEIEGWLVACPLTPQRMLQLPPQVVYNKVVQTGRMAEQLGADILGLGAFTSVVGDGGVTIARRLDIGVTTGDSYTVATAVQALLEAARRMDITLGQATAAIVGATGAIGAVCAELLAPDVAELILIGRRADRLAEVEAQVRQAGARAVRLATDVGPLRDAELVISVTSAGQAFIEPGDLRSGAVVCDVARPRDVSQRVVQERDDVLVFDGGVVDVPGSVDFGFDYGLPPGKTFACMAETMLLAFEGYTTDYTIGKSLQRAQVVETMQLAAKHGFRLSGFRVFERPVTDETIRNVKARAQQRRASSTYA